MAVGPLGRGAPVQCSVEAFFRSSVGRDRPFEIEPAGFEIQSSSFLGGSPPNSGDLNPIETVWAWLRRDLALREQEDFGAKKVITMAQFRQRAAQILKSYEEKAPGQKWSRLQKLVRGMPARLARRKAHRYGRCGK